MKNKCQIFIYIYSAIASTGIQIFFLDFAGNCTKHISNIYRNNYILKERSAVGKFKQKYQIAKWRALLTRLLNKLLYMYKLLLR